MPTPPVQNDPKFAKYLAILIDPTWFDVKDQDIAEEVGIHPSTLSKWKSKVNWEYVRDERRKKYAERITRVDDSMFRAATKLMDTSAAKLMYERFDGWVPTSKQLTEHSLEDGLIDDELKYLADRRAETARLLSNSARMDGEGGGPLPGASTGEGEAKAG